MSVFFPSEIKERGGNNPTKQQNPKTPNSKNNVRVHWKTKKTKISVSNKKFPRIPSQTMCAGASLPVLLPLNNQKNPTQMFAVFVQTEKVPPTAQCHIANPLVTTDIINCW